jgi:hypothetical protein
MPPGKEINPFLETARLDIVCSSIVNNVTKFLNEIVSFIEDYCLSFNLVNKKLSTASPILMGTLINHKFAFDFPIW